MKEFDYYAIAFEDLKHLEDNLCTDYYNPVSFYCQQICEKLLKSVLEIEVPDAKKLLNSHHLKNLNKRLKEAEVDLNLNDSELNNLKDVYYETRYPGENYTHASKEEFTKYLQLTYDVLKAVNDYRKEHELVVNDYTVREVGYTKHVDTSDIFNTYRNKYNIMDDSQWFAEIARLATVFGTSDLAELAKHIQETFI